MTIARASLIKSIVRKINSSLQYKVRGINTFATRINIKARGGNSGIGEIDVTEYMIDRTIASFNVKIRIPELTRWNIFLSYTGKKQMSSIYLWKYWVEQGGVGSNMHFHDCSWTAQSNCYHGVGNKMSKNPLVRKLFTTYVTFAHKNSTMNDTGDRSACLIIMCVADVPFSAFHVSTVFNWID
jgi:hypothetical protein